MLFDLEGLLDGVETALIVGLLVLFAAAMGAGYVFRNQRNAARAELALVRAQAEAYANAATLAQAEAKRHRDEFKAYQAWVSANPAPKDPEALRRWIIEAGKK